MMNFVATYQYIVIITTFKTPKCFICVHLNPGTVKILKFGTPQTFAIIVLKIEKFDVTLHKCIQKMLMEWQTA